MEKFPGVRISATTCFTGAAPRQRPRRYAHSIRRQPNRCCRRTFT